MSSQGWSDPAPRSSLGSTYSETPRQKKIEVIGRKHLMFMFCSINVETWMSANIRRHTSKKREIKMTNWNNAGRFLSEFLALGSLFAAAYVSMMLV